jgi:hypothetical protein
VSRRDVFVSYSRPDSDAANNLVAHLEAHGIPCWIAPRDVEPGAEWAAEIINAIAQARVMVLIFSASANNSPQVRREVERASDRGVRVMAFRVADVVPSGALEYFLGNQHWVDAFPPPFDPHYEKLVYCLNTILATPTNPAPSPEVAPSPAPTRTPPGPRPPRFEATNLNRLESELAVYIGPFAKMAVRHAAAVAPDLESLLRQLGGEITSEKDRHTFMAGCRGWLHA